MKTKVILKHLRDMKDLCVSNRDTKAIEEAAVKIEKLKTGR